jgi:hypothetical protein
MAMLNIEVSGPEQYLLNVYGNEISEIREAIEARIKSSRFSTEDDGDLYLELGVYIPSYLEKMFERLYVTEAGWSHLHTGYETARLYPPALR